MPIENDLTTEEMAEFAEHGVFFDETPPNSPPPPPPPVTTDPASPPPPPPADATVGNALTAEELGERITVPVTRDEQGRFVMAATPATPAPPPAVAAVDPATGLPVAIPAPPPPPPHFVPHAALHAERLRTAELARSHGLLQTRVNAMLAAQRANSVPLSTMPELDPANPAPFITALEERLAVFESERAAETQFREIDASITQDENTFIAHTPDYPAASAHYVRSRGTELLITNTPEDAQKIMTQEVRAIADQAWKRGIPAAQMIYDIARARGYTPGDPNSPPPPPPAAVVTAAPNSPPPPPPALSPAEVIASVAQGKAASRSLSGSGAAAADEINANAILKMSDAEFEQFLGLGRPGANERFAAIGGR